jgi:hypothetical protein
MLRKTGLAGGATMVVLMIGAGTARASSFSAIAGPLIVQSSSTPVVLNNFNPSLGIFDANARADASVGADAAAFSAGTGPFTTNFSVQSASAHSTIDDIIFSGPGPSVDATIRLLFDFGLQRDFQDWTSTPNFTANSTTDQEFSFGFGGRNIQTFNTIFGSFTSADSVPTITSLRPFDPQMITFSTTKIFENDTFLTATIPGSTEAAAGIERSQDFFFAGQVLIHQTFPVGVPIFLDLQISANTNVHALFIANGFADTGGFHSFGLPTGSSGFDLPEGYTVNAPSIGLVNGVIADASVPEPASVGLFGAGCVAMMMFRRALRALNSHP